MLKLSMLMGALILAGLVQGAQDAQDVLRGGVAAAAEQVIVEQVNSRANMAGLKGCCRFPVDPTAVYFLFSTFRQLLPVAADVLGCG